MNTAAQKWARCAVSTRKSTEHNLDLAFTSLDAQREACESYIRSQAGEVLRNHAAGVGRVPAPELGALVVDAARRHLQGNGADPKPLPKSDRELVESYLPRVTLSAKEVTVHLRADAATNEPADGQKDAMFAGAAFTSESTIIAVPWIVPAASSAKGIVHVPAHNTPMKPGSRETLLIAIAKARKWIGTVSAGLSATELASRLPYSWTEQERRISLRH